MAAELTPQQRFDEIMAAVQDAVEKAHADDSSEDISPETERAVDLVRRMVAQALGVSVQ